MPADPRFSPPTCCALATERWNMAIIRYSEPYHGWVIHVASRGRYNAESIVIFFCPWCGVHLPEVTR